jgi:glycosyltransferase involved in cell wall biosynthesis
MRLSVIICTWNRAELLRQTLDSLEKLELPPDTESEVIIVDNNSSDETNAVCQQFLRQNPQRYRYIVEKRQGKSFALNTGIENARGRILSFTDDDVIVDPAWLAETIRMFESSPCVGVSGKIAPLWNFKKPAWR